MTEIGPNTNAPCDMVHADCVLMVGEDPDSSDDIVSRTFGPVLRQHRFRGYVFQDRGKLTTIFSGMGTGCVEALVWELNACGRAKRLLLAGTAGLLPKSRVCCGKAYVIRSARSLGTGMDAIGLCNAYSPRWEIPADLHCATAVSTDFYYGFSSTVLKPSHPFSRTALPQLFARADGDDLVDMEVAQFYALCGMLLPATSRYIAVKSPANPAGIADDHLQNAPGALASCMHVVQRLRALASSPEPV